MYYLAEGCVHRVLKMILENMSKNESKEQRKRGASMVTDLESEEEGANEHPLGFTA